MHQDVENNVKFFRLTSGEDIISEVIETQINEKTSYKLVNPMKIVYMIGRPGYMYISMTEWIFTRVCENQDFELNINEVLITGVPTESIINHYYEYIDHFESSKEDLNKRVKLDAPIESHEHMEMLENQQEERDVPLEELQELIKNAMESKKRTIH